MNCTTSSFPVDTMKFQRTGGEIGPQLRVLMFSDCYWPRVNGVSAALDALRVGLEANNVKVKFIVPAYNEKAPAGEFEFGLRVNAPKFFAHPEDRMVIPTPKLVRYLRDYIVKFRPQIIHIHTPFGMGVLGINLGKSLNLKRVFTYHTLFDRYTHYIPLLPEKFTRFLVIEYSKWFCNLNSAVIAPSRGVKGILETYEVKVPIFVLPSPINELFFSEPSNEELDNVIRKLDLNLSDIYLIFVGRLGIEKNLESTLRVFRYLTESDELSELRDRLKLLLVGDGPQKAELYRIVREVGLEGRVMFTGYLSQVEVRALYKLSKIFLFTSYTETQGLVLAEAMAQGCVPVALRAQGVEDVLEPIGTLAEDEDSMVKMILGLLADTSRYSKLRREAMNSAKRFSARSIGQELREIYINLISGGEIG